MRDDEGPENRLSFVEQRGNTGRWGLGERKEEFLAGVAHDPLAGLRDPRSGASSKRGTADRNPPWQRALLQTPPVESSVPNHDHDAVESNLARVSQTRWFVKRRPTGSCVARLGSRSSRTPPRTRLSGLAWRSYAIVQAAMQV